MHILWQKRPLKTSDGFSLRAILVESTGRKKGKPTQRHVAYLGSLKRFQGWQKKEFMERINRAYQAGFWRQVSEKLNELKLNSHRQKIETALQKKVPRTTSNLKQLTKQLHANLNQCERR